MRGRTATIGLVLGALLAATASLAATDRPTPVVGIEEASVQFAGADANDETGYRVAFPGDVNGDGHPDVAVGAPVADGGGAVYLLHGPVDGEISASEADAVLHGESTGDFAGIDVAGADVNADGVDDLIVGAPIEGQAALWAGAAYVVYGPIDGDSSLGDADAKLMGEHAFDKAGTSVAGAGDVNADGYDDVLVGSFFNDEGGTKAGAGYLVYGPVTGTVSLANADAKFPGEAAGDVAGNSVAGAGDVNADGFDDVLVGAPHNDNVGGAEAGAAYLVHGPAIGTVDLADADARVTGAGEVDEMGFSMATAGDVNADGYDDVLVGAPLAEGGAEQSGAAYLLHGPFEGHVPASEADAVLTGTTQKGEAGISVSAAGDVDDDGVADLAVGAVLANTTRGIDSGAAYLVSGDVQGEVSLASVHAKFVGAAAGDYLGRSVAGGQDVDGNGVADLIVGAPRADGAAGENAGNASIVLGERLDRDTDGLADLTERDTYGSDPLDPDTDGDLADDGTEAACGSSPTDPTSTPPTVQAPRVDAGPDQLPVTDEQEPVSSDLASATCANP